MRVFRGLDSLPKFKNAVLTIGTYDGVHLGHQHIVHRINDLAKNKRVFLGSGQQQKILGPFSFLAANLFIFQSI